MCQDEWLSREPVVLDSDSLERLVKPPQPAGRILPDVLWFVIGIFQPVLANFTASRYKRD